MSGEPRARPAGILVGASRVALLGMRTQLFEKRMLLPLVLLALLPAVAMLGNPSIPPGLQEAPAGVAAFHGNLGGNSLVRPYLREITLLVTLLLATAAIGDELERKTLVHLMIRPVPRGAVYLGKLAWIAGTAWIGLALSVTISLMALTTRLGGELGTAYLAELLLALALSVLIYSALFFLLSLLLPFPTIAGLGYGFGVEIFAGQLPGYFSWISVGYHVRCLFEHRLAALHPELKRAPDLDPMARVLAVDPPEPWQSLALLFGALCFVVAAGWTLMLVREFAGRLGKSE